MFDYWLKCKAIFGFQVHTWIFSMICSALFDLNVIWSELKMEWLWLSLLSSKNFHLLFLSSRWTHLQLYIHAIERCIIANMLQQYENIKRYIFKNNGYSRMKKPCYFWKAYVILTRPPPMSIKSLRRYLRITTYRHLYTYAGSYRYLHTPYPYLMGYIP